MDAARLLARWSALSRQTRVTVVAVFALLTGIVVIAETIAHPQRVQLFAAPLHADQVEEVQERLAAWNVPFTPAADNVLVDAKRRSDLLLRLSLAGTPHEHVDASGDVLAKLGALTPQSVVDAQTRDGLAGDIELALRGVGGVQDARVIIAPGKPGYFAQDEAHDATASVRLTMAAGATLSAEAVSGIRAFVAASVPALDTRNVTIVDDRGIALNGAAAISSSGGDLERSLQSALDSAIGAGVSIVRVHVDYDSRSIRTQDTRRAALAAPAISSTSQSERYAAAGKRYDRTAQEVDRGSETHEMTASAEPGRVARVSAAVFLDAAQAVQIPEVRALAAATLGIDPKRGDVLEVQAVPFTHALPARRDAWWLAYGAAVSVLPALAIGVCILIGLRHAERPLQAVLSALQRKHSIAAARVGGTPPSAVRESLAGEPAHTAAAIISALPAATAAAVLELYPEHERSAIIARMNRAASPIAAGAEHFIVRA